MQPPPNPRYHPLVVERVIDETDDARSLVFAVPDDLTETFAYVAGQFVTLRVEVAGEVQLRSYSMCSAPGIDDALHVTAKRVPGGLVSNWLNDAVRPGDVIEVSPPHGAFVLANEGPVVAFAGGSGVTPIFSIVKTALHFSDRPVRVLFANRDRDSAIFGDALDELAEKFSGQLEVVHHADVDRGFLDVAAVRAFVGDDVADTEFYLCGPQPFMDVVETALAQHAVDPSRVHVERFTPADADDAPEEHATTGTVTITIGNKTATVDQRADSTILQAARWAGLRVPSSCEQGNCATCMARLTEGNVHMRVNDVLTDDEVAEGWVLTCQSVPTTPSVAVVYEQ